MTHRLEMLTRGARDLPVRHQNLRATIDWSYQLLDLGERTLFARLSVFAGGCTIAAAEAVCNASGDLANHILDWLAALADMSLLRQEQTADGDPRFTMLETIREYAQERLEQSGETAVLYEAHLTYFVALAEQAESELLGPGQAEWLERLEQEHDNVRTALAWALKQGRIELGARLGGALWRFWHIRGYLSEGRQWLSAVLAQSISVSTSIHAKALHGAGVLAFDQSDYQPAIALLEECLAIRRALQNQHSIATSLIYLGAIYLHQGDHSRARAYTEECLNIRRSLGDKRGIATALNNLGNVALSQKDFVIAQALYAESLALCRTVGDEVEIANAISNQGLTAFYQGDYEQAMRLYTQSLELFQKLGDQGGEAIVLSNMGAVASARGDVGLAMAYLPRCLKLFHNLNDRRGVAEVFVCLAGVAVIQSKPSHAALLLGSADAIRHAIGVSLSPVEQMTYEQVMDATSTRLEVDMFTAAWAAGHTLTLDEAIAEALALMN
jgi:tetratricopeptide (TPR) repeat protein